ncbi:MAG: acyl-CoA/acyl-ACP dehydrogenase [Acidilobaceae archaeon]|nr:acyl-CoA/acyl-ACP dehydrogenase [Acidilobaceae archaeon]MCX8165609.1 acyl-CoA/acyl-ACP dehydrogenase [Acidilobaceae archaeon]MDW7974036.1 acyl-CoA dehydrogenase family protein [Sulfolobales archaeon]
MDFSLSRDEELFRESIRSFLSKRLSPIWESIDENHLIPTELIRDFGSQGLLGIPIPEEYGGQGGSFTLSVIAAEEVAYHDPSMATAVYTLLNNAWPYILYMYGSEDVKGEILPAVSSGRGFFGIASTEPQGGSDVGAFKTSAVKEGDKYKVYGEKLYVSGVREAMEQLDLGGWLLIARTGTMDERHRGLSTFALIGKRNGMRVENLKYSLLNTIGRHGISTAILTLEGVEVPRSHLVGSEGRGFYIAMEGFNIARPMVAAANIGAARWALEEAIKWSKERVLFDRPISSFQGVSFPLAEISVEIEATRLLIYKAAWLADRIYVKKEPGLKPADLAYYAAAAKMKAVETAFKTFELAMRTLGGISYVKETGLHRGLLGMLSYMVGAEGAHNVMKYITARELIGKDYVK